MSDRPIGEMSFEEAMSALEQVVAALEKGDVPLEQSIALYERGATLKQHCARKLHEAEEKVELIRAAEGRAVGTNAGGGIVTFEAALPGRRRRCRGGWTRPLPDAPTCRWVHAMRYAVFGGKRLGAFSCSKGRACWAYRKPVP